MPYAATYQQMVSWLILKFPVTNNHARVCSYSSRNLAGTWSMQPHIQWRRSARCPAIMCQCTIRQEMRLWCQQRRDGSPNKQRSCRPRLRRERTFTRRLPTPQRLYPRCLPEVSWCTQRMVSLEQRTCNSRNNSPFPPLRIHPEQR